MTKLHVIIGISGSGKSYYAEKIAKENNSIIMASDQKRIEWFGNEEDQDNNSELFRRLYEEIGLLLDKGQNVVLDATNASVKRRRQLFDLYSKKADIIAVYLATPIEEAIGHNNNRDRKVPIHIIHRQYKSLDVPLISEGWSDIIYIDNGSYTQLQYIGDDVIYKVNMGMISHSIFNEMQIATNVKVGKCVEFAQNSKWHTLSVSRHIFEVYKQTLKWTRENGCSLSVDNQLAFIWTSLLHDIGKPQCQTYKTPDATYANYIGHEKVSAQLAVLILLRFGFNTTFITKVSTLVNLHMRVLQGGLNSTKSKNKILKAVGYNQLYFDFLELHSQFDASAK